MTSIAVGSLRGSSGRGDDSRPVRGRRQLATLVLALGVIGCALCGLAGPAGADGPPEAPLTEGCSGPQAPGATVICGTLNPNSSAKVGFYFAYNVGSDCEGGSRAAGLPAGEPEGEGVHVSTSLSGLTPGTQYAICLVATNASGETVGNTLTFMTPPSASPPEAPITGSCPGPFVEGRVCGTLNPNSSAKVGYYFAYNAGSDCHGGSEAPGGGEMEGEAIAVDAELSGLTPGTRYAVCLVATNGSGDTFGNAVHFATRPDESPPQAPITEACGASSAVGTVCGTLNPNSSAKVGYYFAYNLGSDCLDGSRTAPQPEVEGKGIQVSEPLSGLTAGAEYSVCLVATNAFGETPGEVLSLKVPSSRGGGDTGSGGGGSATTGGAGSGPTPATDNPSPTTGNCGALPAGARSTCLRLKKELAKAAGAGRRCRKLATPWARRRCTARAHRRHRHLYTRYEKLIG